MGKESNTKDRELKISKVFDAPVELMWEVWTNADHIRNWWGPNGFTNTISKMDIKPGGEWHLIMHGPDGTNFKNESIFEEVVLHKKISYRHITGPKFLATITFEPQGEKTVLNWHMLFDSKDEFIQTVKTFKADEGLRQNIEKLGYYLQTRINLYKQLKTDKKSRVSTYLNFPGNTEAAFNFYKSVFGGEFAGGGLQRFGDIAPVEGQPQLSEDQKKLILHGELQILGCHYLMATDAPESMGFTVTKGNNMHINLEPDTRKETKRLFDALSKGGEITMKLQDMFWGAYFGSCTDKYGINWFFHCNEPK